MQGNSSSTGKRTAVISLDSWGFRDFSKPAMLSFTQSKHPCVGAEEARAKFLVHN